MSKTQTSTPSLGTQNPARSPFADITNISRNIGKSLLPPSELPAIAEGYEEATLEELAALRPAHLKDTAHSTPFSLFSAQSPTSAQNTATNVTILPLTEENLALIGGAPTSHTRARLTIDDVTVDLTAIRAAHYQRPAPSTNLLDSDDEGERITETQMIGKAADEYKGHDGQSTNSSLEYGPMPGDGPLNLSGSSSLEYGPMPTNRPLNISVSSSLEYGPMPGDAPSRILDISMESDISAVSTNYVAFVAAEDELNVSGLSAVSTNYVAFVEAGDALNDSGLSAVSTNYVIFVEQPTIDDGAGYASFTAPAVTRGLNDHAVVTLTPEVLAQFGTPTSLNNKNSLNISVNTSLGYGVVQEFDTPHVDDSSYSITYVDHTGVSLEYAMANPQDFIASWLLTVDPRAVCTANTSIEYAFANRSDFIQVEEDEYANASTEYAFPNRSAFLCDEEDEFADLSTQYVQPHRSAFLDLSFMEDDDTSSNGSAMPEIFTDAEGNEIDGIPVVSEEEMHLGNLSPLSSEHPDARDFLDTPPHTNCEPVYDFLGLGGDVIPTTTI